MRCEGRIFASVHFALSSRVIACSNLADFASYFRFPPALWVFLAEAWNRSRSPYMICYHSPRHMINEYEFDLELLAQIPTSMHGSKEGHTGYLYQRKGLTEKDMKAYIEDSPCDPVFQESYQLVKAGLNPLSEAVDKKVEENWASRRATTRSVAKKSGVVLSK